VPTLTGVETRGRGARDAPRRTGTGGLAAAAGVAAAAVALGAAAVTAALVAPTAAILSAVGAAFIDLTPAWLKDAAISLFGTQDKLALQAGMVVVVTALGALAGVLGARNRAWGAGLVLVLGAVAALAALTRPGASAVDALPSLVGTAAGVLTLGALLRRQPPSPESAAHAAASSTGSDDASAAPSAAAGRSPGRPRMGRTAGIPRRSLPRRDFVLLTGAAIVVGALATIGGQVLSGTRAAVENARAALRLPRPARVAPPLPAGVQVAGVGPFVTPNRVFYRIDTALTPPVVDPETWSLRVHGLVEREVTITFDELLGEDLVEAWVTLTCVSNEIGGDLAGNAKWLGWPVRELLARAGPAADADMVLSTSADGFTASTPLEVLLDERDALLAVAMNDEPLPVAHGFPVRMVVPGLYGYVSATKWVVDLEVTRFRDALAYWTVRGWAPRAPIKTASRIEVPRDGARVAAGRVMVGGTAWAQTRGIEAVQVRVDEGPWQEADLAAVPGLDTWRQWSYAWDARQGRHELQVRASDPNGPQPEERRPPAPDGATGWHTITVTVAG
jgi:DMSO/TMAO reductase YedYZ molybdopterin-dependent catalytic subunit